MFLDYINASIFSNGFFCALVRFAIAILASYSSFHVIFYRISTHDDLLKYFEGVEYPEDEFTRGFRKFRKTFMRYYCFLTGIAASALLAIQYPESSHIANATAVFYGILGPWVIRDKIMDLMKGKANTSIQKGIIDIMPNINQTANILVNEAFESFEKNQNP